MQNSVLRYGFTLVYWSLPSSVVLCIQNGVFSIRNTSLYVYQPSFVAFACKAATLGPELIVSIGPRPHLWFFAFETATLAPELQVSMGPSRHLWCLLAKQRLLDQNYKSPRVPDLTCRFVLQNIVISTRITNLHGSQTSPVVLCLQNNMISIRITSLYGCQPSYVVFACKTATFGSELQVSMGPRLRLLICECKTAWLEPEVLVSMGPSPQLWFLQAKHRL